MAAGEGVRLRPLTNTRPKVMLQIAAKPLLHHLLLEVKKAGIDEAVIVVRHLKEQIIDYFSNTDIGMEITFVTQGPKRGTADAILAAESEIDDAFVALAGDIVTEASVIKAVMEEHEEGLTVGLKRVETPEEYGVVELDAEGKITTVEEKQKNPKSNLANISIYCAEQDIFKEIRRVVPSPRGEYEITDILIGAKGVMCEGFWMDVGYPWKLFDAAEWLLSRMESKTGDIENSTINGKVIMEEGARIFNSYVEGITYVGAGTTIGPNAYIRGINTIGKHCEIGESTTVKNSILFDKVKAKHLAYIGDSIIGEGVNFGSGTQLANFRFDKGNIIVDTEKGKVDSGRNKLGAIVGDSTKFGVLSCTMPGKIIGEDCWISAGAVIAQNIKPHTHVFVRQELLLESGK